MKIQWHSERPGIQFGSFVALLRQSHKNDNNYVSRGTCHFFLQDTLLLCSLGINRPEGRWLLRRLGTRVVPSQNGNAAGYARRYSRFLLYGGTRGEENLLYARIYI
jgi:hypothetical protein